MEVTAATVVPVTTVLPAFCRVHRVRMVQAAATAVREVWRVWAEAPLRRGAPATAAMAVLAETEDPAQPVRQALAMSMGALAAMAVPVAEAGSAALPEACRVLPGPTPLAAMAVPVVPAAMAITHLLVPSLEQPVQTARTAAMAVPAERAVPAAARRMQASMALAVTVGAAGTAARAQMV